MKWILILVLVTSVAILGCTPAEKSTPEPVNESAPPQVLMKLWAQVWTQVYG